MCATIPTAMVTEPNRFSHPIRACEMPELRVVLGCCQVLERTKVALREQEPSQMHCRASRRTIRQMTRFRHFFEAFSFFITSDQTYPGAGSRSAVPPSRR